MIRGIRMAMDALGQMRLLKGILSKKAVAEMAKPKTFLGCSICGAEHKVTLKKEGNGYVCTRCAARPNRKKRGA